MFVCQKEGTDLVIAKTWISTLNCELFLEFALPESNNVLLNKGLCVSFTIHHGTNRLGSVAMAIINLIIIY